MQCVYTYICTLHHHPRICIHIYVYIYTMHTYTPNMRVNPRSLWISKNNSDVCLRADGEDVHAHRLVLAARSPVFDRMFSTGMQETSSGTVNITDTSAPVVRLLCEFMYTAKFDDLTALDDDTTLSSLIKVAAKYQVTDLLEVANREATRRLTHENAVQWLILAAQLQAEPLKTECLKVVARNLQAVQTTVAWYQLTQDARLFTEVGPELFKMVGWVANVAPPAKKRPRSPAKKCPRCDDSA